MRITVEIATRNTKMKNSDQNTHMTMTEWLLIAATLRYEITKRKAN